MYASQYKDYVLVLLFVKYVSDKYAGQPDALIDVPPGGGFADLVALKGKPDIGEGIDKIIAKLAEANGLSGVIDIASFNDPDKLGKGKEMVDRLSKLVAIFSKPELDFRGNRADGDDLLGDAYEYLMRHFATESGKSKGQFYTPAEVSRIMAKVIGLGAARSPTQTIYDPACGSGSLLLKAHDEARALTGLDLGIYGQEMDNATYALARMNMILHDCATAELWKDNADEMDAAGYSPAEAAAIKAEVTHFENLRDEVKNHSGDAIDLKRYEPAMRHLIDTYIRAEESEKVSAFDDLSLIQLIVERGAAVAAESLPEGIKKNQTAVAETIENNVRKLIIDESPINPKYYDRMSELLDALIDQRKSDALDYQNYLRRIAELTVQAKNGPAPSAYPKSLDTKAKRALYDNLNQDEALALAVDGAIQASRQDGWRGNSFKVKKILHAVRAVFKERDYLDEPPHAAYAGAPVLDAADRVMELVAKQDEY